MFLLTFLVSKPKETNNVYINEDLLHKEKNDPQSPEPRQWKVGKNQPFTELSRSNEKIINQHIF